ncbi:carotenoid oxygenase family protein [Actinoallomurus rhizosphaericola]|uniref:carotenoid oxygenase family protein n=1 Tax=Actinoallomurus rhizosphaericola TaxID=2952536 RepID=UPI0020935EBA|nr:carotenoid oxygenase family protein [Actinoallomurus rhizosphaericola]MCO5998953.1 carotenoid oxygenase family protein [Actinoallomurus rhizosphaericola]
MNEPTATAHPSASAPAGEPADLETTMTLPDHLSGLRAPVADETDAVDLPVTGTLPADLTGRYFRNGPNPLPGRDPGHWFTGDGMLHGVRLRDGRAEWYRNRWVRTRRLDGAPFAGREGVDLTATPANTSVIRHAGRILALVEVGLPYEMTPELETVGPCDFGGRLTTAMTAHPKEDPVTGELHFFGYGFTPPYLTYHRLSARGELVESRVVDVPGPTMIHDFAVTERHVLWLDLPVVFDLELLGAGMPYRWDEAYGARLGVMPRDGGTTRWYDIDPCYVFHVGNACEDEHGRIVLDAVRYPRARFAALWSGIGGSPDPAASAAASGGAHLHRWTLDPAVGALKEEPLDDRDVEFPTFNESRLGRSSRFLYTVTNDAVVKYDTRTGASQVRDVGGAPGEAVYVPAPGASAEDDGRLLSIVTDHSGDGSELLVLDAADLEFVASVRLPRRVPMGFHGRWIED